MPLNDTGNYAIFSNQQLDPELIEQVNVSLGSTDVDSPTAAASGSTVDYRPASPSSISASASKAPTAGSTAAIISASSACSTPASSARGARAPSPRPSMATNDNVYGHRGVIYKQQYNARIYQPIGNNGDFISLADPLQPEPQQFLRLAAAAPGHDPVPAGTGRRRADRAAPRRAVGPTATNRFPLNARRARLYDRALPDQPGRASRRRRRRQHLRQRVRRAAQSVQHRQRPHAVALHAGGRPRPDGRSELPVGEGQWRRHRRRPGRPARRQPGRRHRDSPNACVGRGARPPIRAARSAISAARPISAATSTATATGSTRSASSRRARRRPIAGASSPRCARTSTTPDRPHRLFATIAAGTARPAKPASSSSMASRSTSSRSTIRSSPANGDILQKRDRVSIALLQQIARRISRRVLRRPPDGERRHPRAVLLARSRTTIARPRAPAASSSASAPTRRASPLISTSTPSRHRQRRDRSRRRGRRIACLHYNADPAERRR